MNFHEMGEFCKRKEKENFELMNDQYLVLRLDGVAFHTFTKGCHKPFDERIMTMMRDTAEFLLKKTHAKTAYVQSDEITLFYHVNKVSDFMYGGRMFKILSTTASKASAFFNQQVLKHMPEKANLFPHFDCRYMVFDDVHDSIIPLYWRFLDSRKNAISMVASAFFSHSQLLNKNSQEKIAMLKEKGIDFYNDFSDMDRTGTFIQLDHIEKELTDDEWNAIPASYRPEQRTFIRSVAKHFAMANCLDVQNLEKIIYKLI